MNTSIAEHVSNLESENTRLEELVNDLQTQLTVAHTKNEANETQLVKFLDDRDYFMAQNVELKTLLNSAAALILEGGKKLNLASERRSEIKVGEASRHTDLMVAPESIDAFMEANPLPDITITRKEPL